MKHLISIYPIRVGITGLFLLVASSFSRGATVVIAVDTYVAAADTTTIEGKDVIVNPGVTLTVSGVSGIHNVASMLIGGTVTHLGRETNGVSLRIAGTLEVQAGGNIDVTAKGCSGANRDGNPSNDGETWDRAGVCTTSGGARRAGGSYGGLGAFASVGFGSLNAIYGIESHPMELGSGGGSTDCGSIGGNGGGRIDLEAQSVIVNGSILADGGGPISCAGNGSGGAIFIKIMGGTFSGAGIVRAAGGNGSQSLPGPEGGGGRIAIVGFNTNAFTGTLGRAGTIFLQAAGEGGKVIVDGAVITITNGETRTWHSLAATNNLSTIINQGTIALTSDELFISGLVTLVQDGVIKGAARSNDLIGNFSVDPGGVATHTRGAVRGMMLNVAGTFEVKPGGIINLSEKGYRGGVRDGNPVEFGETWSPGGAPATGASPDGGGSYGTLGGGNSNPTYGLASAPAELGSGGSGSYSFTFGDSRSGGNGGGRLSVSAGNVIVNGQIIADGGDADFRNSGGGSGGAIAIVLRSGSFSGNGVIRVNGGRGTSPASGQFAGGGGRIAIVGYAVNTFTGTLGEQGTLWMRAGHVPGVARTGNLVTISWPTLLEEFILQSADSMPPPMMMWTTVTNTPVVVGDAYTVTVEAGRSQQFFRLKK